MLSEPLNQIFYLPFKKIKKSFFVFCLIAFGVVLVAVLPVRPMWTKRRTTTLTSNGCAQGCPWVSATPPTAGGLLLWRDLGPTWSWKASLTSNNNNNVHLSCAHQRELWDYRCCWDNGIATVTGHSTVVTGFTDEWVLTLFLSLKQWYCHCDWHSVQTFVFCWISLGLL